MRNVKLTIEYDGTAYCGWQVQSNGLTVQEVLQKHLAKMTCKPVKLTGASRTDAGVHALGQVANFKTESKIPCNGFLKGLNSMLPKDISIKSVEEMPNSFHAKKSAKGKHYRYLIATGAARSALLNNRVWHLLWAHKRQAALLKGLRGAIRPLIGTHDFSAFCAAGDCNKSKVRKIDKIVVKKVHGDEGLISIDIFGSGFLKYMIRNIVGTLVGTVQRWTERSFKSCLKTARKSCLKTTRKSCLKTARKSCLKTARKSCSKACPACPPKQWWRERGLASRRVVQKRPDKVVQKILKLLDRKKAGVTAPAHGLYLVKIVY